MHGLTKLSGAALLLLALAPACDTFDPEAPAAIAPEARILQEGANATEADTEARALARPVITSLLAYAKHCRIDSCFGWGQWEAASDACAREGQTDLAKAAESAVAPLVTYVEAHPELDGKVKTFTTHAKLLAERAQQAPYRGVLARFQATAVAYNAWITADPVETDPIEDVVCSADPEFTYKFSKKFPNVHRPLPWVRCNGVPCFRTNGDR
jgi:hypothetical protein